ncbi:metal ABC transporter solute-binding protein, Zn/Mn family [Clostridium sp. Cult2]|uniref:metal ABC transporter solute-binding protein, Zn/Mn family n=1 Tax=Clostridium sp. Cult2 TaxID=2079003 RepID=UPI001F2A4A83|nr:zinc ABC transporter substrate-binding protein [Clostridium sp. Cult2]
MKKLIIIFTIITLLITGCSSRDISKESDGDKLLVYTSFYPLYFLADEIGGTNIDLKMVIPSGVDSHDYEPSMKQLKEIEQAEIFIYNGADFESWADKLIGTIVDEEKTLKASEAVELISDNGISDPHIWLNPENMNIIGKKIKERFILIDEKNKDEYEKNFNELSKRLITLDNQFMDELKNKKKDTILVSHSAFAYMAERYNFHQLSVAGISPEQEPSPRTIANIIEIVEREDYEYIFLETLANPKTVDIIAEETNLKTLILNPIEGLTEEEQNKGEDYISIMEKNLENLKKALVE